MRPGTERARSERTRDRRSASRPETPEAGDAPLRRSRLRRACRGLGALALAAAAGGTAVAVTARWTHWGELLVNLSGYFGALALLAAAALALARRYVGAGAAALLGAWQLAPVVALAAAERPAVPAGPTVRVATVNVHYGNRDAPRFLEWLEAERPAVLGVLEATPFWRRDVLERPEVLDAYPFRVAEPPRESGFSMLLLSRHPLVEPRVHETPHAWRSYLEADVEIDGAPLHVVLVHPARPGLGWGTTDRNAYLLHIARETRWRRRSVLLGDFNATLWSPVYADLLEATPLVDTRRGFGWQPSWRSVKYVAGIWLDLDHVFVGEGIGVLDRAIGPDVGSDHRPVVASLQLAPPAAAGGVD